LLSLTRLVAGRVLEQPAQATSIADALEPFVAEFPQADVWVEQRIRELLDILDLPVWKKREGLYAVWIATLLLRAIEPLSHDLAYHTGDGILAFSFGGSRLASFARGDAAFDLWTEMRTALLPGHISRMRSEGIQPDYRVVRASGDDVNVATEL